MRSRLGMRYSAIRLAPLRPQTPYRADRARRLALRLLFSDAVHGARAVAERRLLELRAVGHRAAVRSAGLAAERSADGVLHADVAGEVRLARVPLEPVHRERHPGLGIVRRRGALAVHPRSGAR